MCSAICLPPSTWGGGRRPVRRSSSVNTWKASIQIRGGRGKVSLFTHLAVKLLNSISSYSTDTKAQTVPLRKVKSLVLLARGQTRQDRIHRYSCMCFCVALVSLEGCNVFLFILEHFSSIVHHCCFLFNTSLNLVF